MKRLTRIVIAVVLALTMLVSTASALTVDQALELLEKEYLREIPVQAYEAESLEELFEILGDPYTYYMSKEEYQAFLDNVESTVELVGIGVSMQYTEQGIYVVEPLKNGGAYAAGIQSGDYIVAVDGVSCVPADESHRSMILGEEGTQVTLTVLRDGVTMDFVVTRSHVVVNNTEVSVEQGHIGYIDCDSFGSNTGKLFLEGVQTHNESVDCWLVDLRTNSGGYTTAAVDALGVFSGLGFLLYLQDQQGRLYYYSYEDSYATEHMAVVLVDGYTASAAEAFSAGIRDIGLGVTVGSRTYGKGVAQIVYDETTHPEYFDGDGLKLTAYRFYSVGGITNDLIGIIPTLMVSDEMAYDVAVAVCGNPQAKETDIMVVALDDYLLEVDLASVSDATLSALFEALPPSAHLWVYDQEEEQYLLTVTEAAETLGVKYSSRWFQDVGESVFANEINALATYGIVEGDGMGSFYPVNNLKRSEVCAMLGRALGLVENYNSYFSDVRPDDPCTPYINAMAELGLVQGVGDGKFNPNGTLSQQEYFTILGRAMRYLNVNADFAAEMLTQEQLNAAVAMGFHSWAVESAALLDSSGALRASSGVLQPTAPILREEAAASLHAVLAGMGVLPD